MNRKLSDIVVAGIILSGLLGLAAMWLTIVRQGEHERRLAEQSVVAVAGSLARAVEVHNLRTFRMIDQALLHIRRDYERDPASLADSIAEVQSTVSDLVLQVAIADETGIVVASDLGPITARFDVSDREHFRVHEGGGDRLFISKPILGRVSQKWSIQFVRPLRKAGGGFGGIIVLSVDPSFFSTFYKSMDLGEGSLITMIGTDGVLRALAASPPMEKDALGLALPPDWPFLQPDSPVAGSFPTVGVVDGEDRLLAWRRMSGYPIVVAVSYTTRAAFAASEDRRRIAVDRGAFATLVVTLLCAGLVWLVLRQARVQAQIERSRSQLAQQAAELARSNADLESFAYVASHDLREPLRMVSSYLTLLERRIAGSLDDDSRAFIGFARDGAERMNRLIIDLLDYSRVGRSDHPWEPVALAEVMEQVAQMLAPGIAEAKAELVVAPGLPATMGVADDLVRLFVNLVGNALKYREPSRPLRIEVATGVEDGFHVVSVKDNGIGIEPEYKERIFRIFQRLHGRDEYGGTGIGLAVCKKITERHGGRIWVESRPGRGSTFRVALPMMGEAQAASV